MRARVEAPIVVPGRNCWRREHAGRVAFLVDAAAYFEAFAAAVARAERSILIVSWDIDSRMRLWHDEPDVPDRLGAFLNAVVSRRPGLHANVLSWDFAMIYAFEREMLPVVKLGWRTHRRLHFRLDGRHPIGACHHQKVVVVDDAIAFAGGLDLCTHRWDTRAHRASDPRRLDAAGNPYGPFHDVQIAVDGAAASALGDLVRSRWFRATGRRIAAPPPRSSRDPWPASLRPDVTDVDVAIARTEPELAGREPVSEVKALFLDSIGAARRSIYVENQYLTSACIADALAARLRERDGPEIVLVLPRHCSGWLEEQTMGVLRAGVLQRLRAADRWHRLRVYSPTVPGIAEGCLNVHSKVMVVDDRLLRVGSANMSNRSMGFDTECDLALDATGDARVARAITAFRDGLLGEHLGVPSARVAEAVAEHGSLVAAVDALRGGPRTLEALEIADPLPGALVSAASLADPERPVDPERLLDEILPNEVRDGGYRPFMRGGALMVGVALAIALWSIVSDRGLLLTLSASAAPLRASALAPLWVVTAYVVGGLVFVPVTLLTLLTITIFDVTIGVSYAVVGTLASAGVGYLAGRVLGRNVVRRVAGRRLNRLTRRLLRGGPLAVAGARAAAIVPFTSMNLVAGASRVPAPDYVLGTIVGTVPGVTAIGLLAAALRAGLRAWGVRTSVIVALAGVLVWFAGRALGRRRREARAGNAALAASPTP